MTPRRCLSCNATLPTTGSRKRAYCSRPCAQRAMDLRYPSLSVSDETYRALSEIARLRGVKIRTVVEALVEPALEGWA